MKQCHRCHGNKFTFVKVTDLSGRNRSSIKEEVMIVCPMCSGNGNIIHEDVDKYYKDLNCNT